MTTRRQWLVMSGVGGLALAGGLGAALWKHGSSEASRAAVDQLFQARFPDASGVEQPLSQWRGKPLVVNFWATWCLPCVEEMPDLQRIQDDFGPRGAQVIGIGIDNPKAVAAFRAKLDLRLPLLVAGAGGTELARALGNPGGALPYTVVISRDGRVLTTHLGRFDAISLRGWVNDALA